jgi:hypothetical protein
MSTQLQFACFHPWIGKNYWNKPFLGKRILIVQDNSVVFKRPRTTITTDPMQTIREVEGGYVNYLLPPLKGVDRHKWSESQRQTLRNSVAIYNYHQCNFTRLTPDELPEMQPILKDRLHKILGQLRPQIIAIRGSIFTDDEALIGGSHLERVEFRFPSGRLRRCTLERLQYPNGSAMAFMHGGFFDRGAWIGMIRLAVRRSS